MNRVLAPGTAEELAEALGEAGRRGFDVTLAGASSKRLMAGPVARSFLEIATGALDRVLEYEPRDLTVSVEAGVRWCELTRLLASHRQMIPLDPPFAESATVGGVVASNGSGPRRRFWGTARDCVIGMRFATMEGKLVDSGGMVVKNVAGLDMAKLMIGSFGTLAAIASVNFKLAPAPDRERTFVLPLATLDAAMDARDAVLRSVLQPAALDLLTPASAAELGWRSYVLAVQAAGNAATLERYRQELGALGRPEALEEPAAAAFWQAVREFAPRRMDAAPEGAVVRVSSSLEGMRAVLEAAPGHAVARAGSGVTYAFFEEAGLAAEWAAEAHEHGCKAVLEFAPEARKRELDLWPSPGADLDIMRRVKNLFDPRDLLNRGRLYGRI